MGEDYQRRGTSPPYLVGKPQLGKQLQTGPEELKITTIKASIQRTPLLNIWVQQDTNAHPFCLQWIFFSCVYREATKDNHIYAGCTRSLCVLRASWYQHRDGYGK